MYRFWGGQIWCGGEGGPKFLWKLYFCTQGVWFTYQIFKTEKNIKKWKSGFFRNLAPPGRGLIIEI